MSYRHLLLITIITCLPFASSEARKDYGTSKVLRARNPSPVKTRALRDQLREAGLSVWKVDLLENTVDFLVTGEEDDNPLLEVLDEDVAIEVVVANVEERFEAEREAIKERELLFSASEKKSKVVDFDIFNFHTLEEINQYLFDLEGGGIKLNSTAADCHNISI